MLPGGGTVYKVERSQCQYTLSSGDHICGYLLKYFRLDQSGGHYHLFLFILYIFLFYSIYIHSDEGRPSSTGTVVKSACFCALVLTGFACGWKTTVDSVAIWAPISFLHPNTCTPRTSASPEPVSFCLTLTRGSLCLPTPCGQLFNWKHFHERSSSDNQLYKSIWSLKQEETAYMADASRAARANVNGVWIMAFFCWRHAANTTGEDRRRVTHLSGAEGQGSQLQLINIPGSHIGCTYGCQLDPHTV